MRLWIESAHRSLTQEDSEVCRDAISIFQTQEQFFALLAGAPPDDAVSETTSDSNLTPSLELVQETETRLQKGQPLGDIVESLTGKLPPDLHLPFAALQVAKGEETLVAQLVECDAPPLFLIRDGKLVLLPVIEEILHGRLIRRCHFQLQNEDRLAMVSEGFIQVKGWERRWGWPDIAASVRRLTGIRCDAEQLLNALVSSFQRFAQGDVTRDVSVVAMSVRPLRSATVWTGPPADPEQDKLVLDKLMSEPGTRIICGDTTADIAARLLDAEIIMDPRPEDGWREVPPTSQLEGIDLVTEGVVTMNKTRERVAEVKKARDLPRQDDGATRLARALLEADVIHFLVGLAVNPAQTADPQGTRPMRTGAVSDLIQGLRAHAKILSVEWFGPDR